MGPSQGSLGYRRLLMLASLLFVVSKLGLFVVRSACGCRSFGFIPFWFFTLLIHGLETESVSQPLTREVSPVRLGAL